METRKVSDMLKENLEALKNAKGHAKKTVLFSIACLARLPQEARYKIRHNTVTPTNGGDVGEVWAALELGFIEKDGVGLNDDHTDLPTILKNEVKVCYSNNRPSNDIEDKGHWMVVLEGDAPALYWVPRHIVRANRSSLIKGRRGGNTYAKAVLETLEN